MRVRLLALLALLSVSQASFAQPIEKAIARIKSCLDSDGTARQECVDRLWRELDGSDPPASGQSSDVPWIVSETLSPLDYSPQVTATKLARSTVNNAPSTLTIGCRAQRIEISVGTAGAWKPSGSDELRVSHRINGQPEVQGRWAALGEGRTAVFRGDAAKFLSSLADGGQLWVRVHDGLGLAHEATFQLGGLEPVRQKIIAVCSSPSAKSDAAPAWR